MSAVLAPVLRQRFFDQNGAPLSGGKVYSYAGGSVGAALKATYKDALKVAQNTNPVILDAAGYADIWLADDGLYDFVIRDTLNNVVGTVVSVPGGPSTTLRTIFSDTGGAAAIGTTDGGTVQGFVDGFLKTQTINVPADYANIASAFDYLRAKRIAPGATVTVKVANGTYAVTSTINVAHIDGERIRLIGDETNAANCILRITGVPTFDVIVADGASLGWLNGFRIEATGRFQPTVAGDFSGNFTGILANRRGSIVCGLQIQVNNFYYGIAARVFSFIDCPGAQVNNAGDVGIWAYRNSTVQAVGSSSTNAADVANDLGYGYQGEYQSLVVADSSTTTGCRKAGFAALTNSMCQADSSTANANLGSGYYTRVGGQVQANGGIATNNSRYAIEIGEYGGITGLNFGASTGNTLGTANSFAFFDVSTGTARIGNSAGDMRYDSQANTFFNQPNGLAFQIIYDSSIGALANRLAVRGKATGVTPTLEAIGSDAIIDLAILPKGTGSFVKIGAGFFATADAPIVGHMNIKDDTGTVRKLAIVG